MLEVLNRINELANKQKEAGLTQTELDERIELREKYLQMIRGQIHTTVTGLKILDPLGNDVTPDKLKERQKLALKLIITHEITKTLCYLMIRLGKHIIRWIIKLTSTFYFYIKNPQTNYPHLFFVSFSFS